MKKVYVAKLSFWIGALNKELKAGAKVDYDDEKNILYLNNQTFEVNLKSSIKEGWLSPEDGVLPQLSGPVGETQVQEADRKRKERFAEMEKEKRTKIVKDSLVIGSIDEEKRPSAFAEALGLEPNPPKRGKFVAVVQEDDSKVVSKVNLENKDVKSLKKALGQDPKKKEVNKGYEVFTDHYDAEAVELVGKYTEGNKESTLQTWSTLHWTKKADVIKESNNKDFLTKLKSVEQSEKIIERINTKLSLL